MLKKFFTYLSILCLVVASFSVDIFAATRKKSSKSSKRAATSTRKSGAKKRAATSNRRAAVSNRRSATSTRRSASSTRRSSVSTRSAMISSARGVSSSAKSGPACPIGKVVRLNSEDELYYSTKTKTCSEPENTVSMNWEESVKSSYAKPSWIDETEAVYFVCDDGYIQQGKGAKAVCVDVDKSCPLNTVVKKQGTTYISLETEETCNLSSNTILSKATSDEIEEAGADEESAKNLYYTQCKKNYYSASASGSDDVHVVCKACPSGTEAPAGSLEESACLKPCENGLVRDKKGTCTTYNGATVKVGDKYVCKAGYYGDGIGTDGCKICPEGSYCPQGSEEPLACQGNTYSASEGAEECTTCPTELNANDAHTACSCSDGMVFNPSSNSCVSTTCSVGYLFKTNKCEACPAGTRYVAKGTKEYKSLKALFRHNATIVSEAYCKKCSAGYYSPAGATNCTPCPVNTYSSSGASSCTTCPKGTYSDETGASSCTKTCPKSLFIKTIFAKRYSSCK